MKIKLTEEQFKMLIREESGEGAPAFDDGDIKEYPGSEVTTSAPVHDVEGEVEYGHNPDTDKVMGDITQQAWGFGWSGPFRKM